MTTDPQHLLSAPIPFYRRRWFWGVVIFSQTILSLILFNELVPRIVYEEIFGALFYATGGGVFFILAGIVNEQIYTTLYFLALVFLAWKIFNRSNVRLIYPIAYLTFALLSTYLTYHFIFRIY